MLLSPWKTNSDIDDFFLPTFYNLTPPPWISKKKREWDIDTFKIDMVDSLDRYQVKAELPGRLKESIKIKIDNGYLTISSTTGYEEKSEDTFLLAEIQRGSMSRTISLPEKVDEDSVVATYSDGILEIVLPKTNKSSKEISIM